MDWNPRIAFLIRRLLFLTAIVIVLVWVGLAFFHREPLRYHDLEWFTTTSDLRGWNIEVEPDIPGPYRTVGDHWSGVGATQFNPGRPATGWVQAGGTKRSFDYPGRSGVSYLVFFLETKDDALAYLILSKFHGNVPSSVR
ncbi:hypothetical protein [Stieleria varia]|uniref:Uncharacterized protein n=1 Tax=Stieleria varia TaxID=2528005 RepID=A0A5C6B8E0_9BACT|nr:hypothetical protein [Stieleria varia]TWU07516.1 hypothetical protein Pla52n_00890 [Stieleria varia]